MISKDNFGLENQIWKKFILILWACNIKFILKFEIVSPDYDNFIDVAEKLLTKWAKFCMINQNHQESV